MRTRMKSMTLLLSGVTALALMTSEAWSQRRGGGGGGGRNAGHVGQGAQHNVSAGPAMTRPANMPRGQGHAGGQANGIRPNAGGVQRPNLGAAGGGNSGGGFHRPNAGAGGPNLAGGPTNLPGKGDRPNLGGATTLPGKIERPNIGGSTNLPGKGDRPNLGGATTLPGKIDRPNLGGATTLPGTVGRPNIPGRPGGGPSSGQLNDFLGGGNRPGGTVARPVPSVPDRPNLGNVGNKIDRDDLRKPGGVDANVINNRRGDTNVNVGDVNIGNSINYSKNQQAWVNNRHTTGNQVRNNSGNRYASAYNNGTYRRGVVGGYPYANGWNNRGAYYGWRPATYVGVGTFIGATWANATPRYYAYGDGGNVYYENNVVYVDGQPAGTPEQYAAQSTALVAAAPAEIPPTEEWLPLGSFAFTREGVDDSQSMIELAVSKQGVIAGTYYNETTGASRSLKGMIDKASQRVAVGFADGKNADLVLETGVNNLTQDEAPGLLHQGKDRSTPVLLVRLQPPTETAAN